MKYLFGLTLGITAVAAIGAHAASPERVRGTVSAVTAESVTVHTADKDVAIGLTSNTHYLKVVKSSLNMVDKDSFIGTATKEVGGKLVALEVVIFPPAMKGTGEGHYGWDRISDTTLSGGKAATSSMMTRVFQPSSRHRTRANIPLHSLIVYPTPRTVRMSGRGNPRSILSRR